LKKRGRGAEELVVVGLALLETKVEAANKGR
jgi:hypothetical protein